MIHAPDQLQSAPVPLIFDGGSRPVLVASQLVRTGWHNYASETGYASQLIRVASAFTVAAVGLFLLEGVPNNVCHVEFWTAPARGGTQIGVASESFWNPPGTGHWPDGAWSWFNWTGAKPPLTADCYLTFWADGFMPASSGYGEIAGGSYYRDTTFCLYDGATAWPNADLCFQLLRLP